MPRMRSRILPIGYESEPGLCLGQRATYYDTSTTERWGSRRPLIAGCLCVGALVTLFATSIQWAPRRPQCTWWSSV